jgi:hypothetical protein
MVLLLAQGVVSASPSGGTDASDTLIPRVVARKPSHTIVPPGYSTSRVQVKFREGTDVRLRGGRLVSPRGDDLSALDRVLARYPGTRIERLFERPEDVLAIERDRIEQTSRRAQADKNLFYRLVLGRRGAAAAAIDELNALDMVELASSDPLPASPPSTALYETSQQYRDAAPVGIGVDSDTTMPGGRGEGSTIADVEYAWNTNHEDLSAARAVGAVIANKTPVDPFGNPSHGTAVLGELVGDANTFGVTGIASSAALRLVNAVNAEDDYDVADAIDLAHAALNAGDVLLIEQQLRGPAQGEDYVPVEWNLAAYEAIVSATSDGITVVEPAGNGGQDLDSASFGSPFPEGRLDSGAIIVGADNGCVEPRLARASFSTYGSRVNLQGWGRCVVTTGYGDLYNGGPNATYTQTFNGTSSASPIVAGAAALISRVAYGTGSLLSPTSVRSLLVATGTPQDPSVPGHIGPLPNLAAAVNGLTFPAVSIRNARVAEGDTGTSTLTFTVRLSKPATAPVTVAWSTVDASATAGGDYVPVHNAQLVFAPGVTQQSISVTVYGDTQPEPSEKLVVELGSAPGLVLRDAMAVGAIQNDDRGTR